GYRVCYHEKDFVGGRSIASNIVEAIACSKRVVCLMTVHFINSSYCMFEFRTSLQRNVQLNRERLIAILDDSL
ncbi:hypothetical protein HELRODRAFT_148022, partial [Helobdella robusta]|uniref:TIR domain-containing protein n=1 Tax=Helobdella robusta TaxID=6412 RepID=T1EK40_HELRO